MPRKVEITYVECHDYDERVKKSAEIIAEGVYTYLKKNGCLRDDMKRTEQIKQVIEKAKEMNNQIEEEMEIS